MAYFATFRLDSADRHIYSAKVCNDTKWVRYGLAHIIVNTMTPINDSTSQMVQFCLRNDTEVDTPSQDMIAFDRAVTLEDKRILESTDYDVWIYWVGLGQGA